MRNINWKSWTLLLQPKTYLLAVSPVLVGIACAYRDGAFQPIAALLCILFACLLQMTINLSNEDLVNSEEKDVSELESSGNLNSKTIQILSRVIFCLSFFIGGLLAYKRSFWVLAAVSFLLFFVFICRKKLTIWDRFSLRIFLSFIMYGFIPVCLTYYLLTNGLSWTVFYLSLSMGLLSVNVFLVYNHLINYKYNPIRRQPSISLCKGRFVCYFYLINALLAILFAFPVYFYRSWNTWFLFLFFFALQIFTWQDLNRLQGADLKRIFDQTIRNVFLFALMIVSVLLY